MTHTCSTCLISHSTGIKHDSRLTPDFTYDRDISRPDQPEAPDEPASRIVRHCLCLATARPWLRAHLPDLDEAALRNFIQLATGIVEQHSLLLCEIAASSVFQASPESNYTQVQRIIRDQRLSL